MRRVFAQPALDAADIERADHGSFDGSRCPLVLGYDAAGIGIGRDEFGVGLADIQDANQPFAHGIIRMPRSAIQGPVPGQTIGEWAATGKPAGSAGTWSLRRDLRTAALASRESSGVDRILTDCEEITREGPARLTLGRFAPWRRVLFRGRRHLDDPYVGAAERFELLLGCALVRDQRRYPFNTSHDH